jgi:hypothetical protein
MAGVGGLVKTIGALPDRGSARFHLGDEMTKRTSRIIAVSLAAAFAATTAWAQQKPVRVTGSITAVEGTVLTVKAPDGAVVKV